MEAIELPVIIVAGRNIRYIIIENLAIKNKPITANAIKTINCNSKLPSECCLLFLGADMLNNCPISKKNLAREHSKYCKDGLASKIEFPSQFKVKGMPGSPVGLWFYTVQGFLKIAFEFYSNLQQKDVIDKLYNHWVSAFAITSLPNTINIDHLQSTSHSMGEHNSKSLKPHHKEMKEISTAYQNVNTSIHYLQNLLDKSQKNANCTSIEQLQDIKTLLNFASEGLEMSKVNTPVTKKKRSTLNKLEQIPLLSSLAAWIGKKFCESKNATLDNANELKLKYINKISDLPSEKDITSVVFTSPMVLLLRNWIGYDDTMLTGNNIINNDRLILLILELINGALISSLSHIVQAKLSIEMLH